MTNLLYIALLMSWVQAGGLAPTDSLQAAPQPILIDNFEAYKEGGLPTAWKYLDERALVPVAPKHMREREQFYVVNDRGNKVLRVYTDGEAVHLTMANEADGFDWDVQTHPVLQWRWRAQQLPPGAREDKEELNDVAAGFYVYFSLGGLLKRPQGIKYSYSSTLPVGTVVSYGRLKVVVVSSGLDQDNGWITIQRNVVDDYKTLFGGDPPDRPISIRLWGDSDNTRSIAQADFDDIKLLPAR